MLSREGFLALLMPCERSLYCVSRSILRSDADCADAVAEAISKAWAARARFREGAPFRPWITRILINECRNIQRQRMRVLPVAVVFDRAEPARGEQLQDALSALPDQLRLPLVLHHLEGFSVAEIAAMLKTPSGTVKWRLSRARAQMRVLLSEEEGVKTT